MAQETDKRFNAEYESEVRTSNEAINGNIINLEELENPNLGDESAAFHVRASFQILGTTTNDIIVGRFRKGKLLVTVAWNSNEARILLSDVIALAKKPLERVS